MSKKKLKEGQIACKCCGSIIEDPLYTINGPKAINMIIDSANTNLDTIRWLLHKDIDYNRFILAKIAQKARKLPNGALDKWLEAEVIFEGEKIDNLISAFKNFCKEHPRDRIANFAKQFHNFQLKGNEDG